MKFLKVKVEDVPANSSDKTEPGYERIPYRENEEGIWVVLTNHVDGAGDRKYYRPYANADADESDLRQLLKKEYDIRY